MEKRKDGHKNSQCWPGDGKAFCPSQSVNQLQLTVSEGGHLPLPGWVGSIMDDGSQDLQHPASSIQYPASID
jgi:hypothetical protein